MLQLGLGQNVTGRERARTGETGIDPTIYIEQARRLRAETIEAGGERIKRRLRRLAQRLTNGRSPAPDADRIAMRLGRASVAEALRRDLAALGRLVRRFIVEPYARRRRRKDAIAQLQALDDWLLADIGLSRGDIERVVDGKLPHRSNPIVRLIKPSAPTGEGRQELRKAA